MRISVIKAYILKEFKELIRSKLIIMVYLMPNMVLLLFGYGIRMEVEHSRTIVLDNDNSKLSLAFIQKLENSKYFDTEVLQISEKRALKKIKRAEKDIVIIIPSSFEKRVLKNQPVNIGVFIDGSFPIRATTMQGYIGGEIFSLVENLMKKIGKNIKNITINHRALFNQAMRDEDAIVPGIIGLVLLVAPAILAALLIVKEKEHGTIFNFYSSSIGKIEFLMAKLIPVFILHSLNIFFLFLSALYIFEVPFRGDFFIYWLTSEIYICISLSIGLLVSIITNRQIVAVVLTVIITIIPGFLYSGIMTPISSMKGTSSYIEAHLFPVMYYNTIIYDTFLIGQGFSSVKNMLYLFILLFYATFLLTFGSFLLKKELK